MRKSISLAILALVFSMLSGHALASNVEVCDQLRGKEKGLCVAWHNADDRGKVKIAERFEILTGYQPPWIVGGAFLCPCWSGLALNDIGKDTAAEACFLDTWFGDVALFGSSGQQQDFLTDGINCGYIADYIDSSGAKIQSTRTGLDLGEIGEQCAIEMQQILDEYFANGADCF